MGRSTAQRMVGATSLLIAMAFSSPAAANSITVEFAGGGATVILDSATAASVTLAVKIYANFSDVGGGTRHVGTALRLRHGLKATACKEPFLQVVNPGPNNSLWGRMTPNCGEGFPGDGGIGAYGVSMIEQELRSAPPSTSGTILMGTVTFHVVGTVGNFIVNPTYDLNRHGFLGDDEVRRAPTYRGGVTVWVTPEPATAALLGLGLLGILGYSRRRRER